MDEREFYLKVIELDKAVRDSFIAAYGGAKELGFHIAQEFGVEVTPASAASALGITGSGARKRLQKIKGNKAPKTAPESGQNSPTTPRKRPSRKKPT